MSVKFKEKHKSESDKDSKIYNSIKYLTWKEFDDGNDDGISPPPPEEKKLHKQTIQ